jgi:hypothetical protein
VEVTEVAAAEAEAGAEVVVEKEVKVEVVAEGIEH